MFDNYFNLCVVCNAFVFLKKETIKVTGEKCFAIDYVSLYAINLLNIKVHSVASLPT